MTNQERLTGNPGHDKKLNPQSHKLHLEDIATERIHNGTVQRKALIRSGEVGEVASMNYAWLEPGEALEEHDHPDCFEYYLFLEGSGIMTVADEAMNVGKGDFVSIHPTERHSLQASADSAILFLTMRAFERNT